MPFLQPALIQIKPYGVDISPIALDIEPLLISIRPRLETIAPQGVGIGPNLINVRLSPVQLPGMHCCKAGSCPSHMEPRSGLPGTSTSRPNTCGLLQVAGRRLLAGDSSSQEQPSNEDLYLQSYRNCELQRTLPYTSLRCMSCAPMPPT